MKYSILFILFASLFAACDPENKKNNSNFDRKAMLANYADNLIIPSFTQLQQKTSLLHQAAETFTQQPDVNNLLVLQNSWKEAVKAFQYCNSYNFGPAETTTGTLTQEIATFPVNTVSLEQFIISEDYTLNNFARDTRGFFGIEYLIFNQNNDNTEITASYNNADGNKRKEYLKAITNNLNDKVATTNNNWSSYRAQFINSDGTSAGSGTSEVFNNFLLGFENAKNFKLGLPLGLRAGQAQSEPTKVEGYYSGISKELLLLNYNNTVQIYYGRNNEGTEGIGFDDYLKSIEGGNDLINETQNQFNKITTAFNNIPDDKLSTLIEANNSSLSNLYTEMQNLTRFVKSDMSSLLGISITYSSGDGD